MVAWGTRVGVDVGDLELEPAWDLICTPEDQKWSRGKEWGARSEAQQNRVDGHPEVEQETKVGVLSICLPQLRFKIRMTLLPM